MWLLLMVLGLSAVGAGVLVWFLQWRKARQDEHLRLWKQHDDWLRNSRQDP